MKNFTIKRLTALALVANVAATNAQEVVKVAAAANLRYALSEMESVYESQHREVDLQINYGATGTFYQQIVNGAPFDLFLAADEITASKVKEQGFAIGNCEIYACGKLALYGLRDDIDDLGMKVLDEKNINRISVANPRTAPYGTRSVELLKSLNLWSSLERRIAYGDSIAQAAQFAMTGNTDIGFVALSLLLDPKAEIKGSYYVIPEELYDPITQAGVLIKQRGDRGAATAFFNFILSDECSPIWGKYGYSPAR
ncbi:MAG: molybdate ABC transporter substrate-binding protein [Rikenellaceae bacterium]